MKKLASLIACVVCAMATMAQQSAVQPGERFVYAASYNMSGLMTQLAQVTMETEMVKTASSTYLHLSCQAATYSKWDSYFKIRDLYESYVNPSNFKPSLYKRDIFEGKYTKKEKYVFKSGNTIVSTMQKKKNPETKRTFNIGSGTQDVISTMYKLRTIDFSKMKPGQAQNFTIVFDEKEMAVSAKLMGVETISAGNLGSKKCYKVSIAARTHALRGTDKNIIWLTADSRKVPALIRFSIPVGTGEIALTNASGI